MVESIIQAAKDDGVKIQTGFDAVGQLQSCVDILKACKGDDGVVAKLASAPPPVSLDPSQTAGVEVKFVAAPDDEEKRTESFRFIFGVWLKEKLAKGEFVPSPRIRVVEGGLEAADQGLDEWKRGVSGEKLVLEV